MIEGFDLYGFAMGPAFTAAVLAFTFGAFYRLSRYVLFWRKTPKPKARNRGVVARVVGLVDTFTHPIVEGFKGNPVDASAGLLALHLLGAIPLLFLMDHHIAAFDNILPKLGPLRYGLLKPLSVPLSFTDAVLRAQKGLPLHTVWGPLVVVLNGDVLAVMTLVGAGFKVGLWFSERARGLRGKRLGDLAALLLVILIVLTGFLAAHHVLPETSGYRTVLGLHILLAETLLALMPFTRFWHFIFDYWFGKLHEWYELKVMRGVT